MIFKKKVGSKIEAVISANAIHDDRKNIVAIRGIIRDVSEQKKLEMQFLQSQKMESIGLLAGGIAHDFNNILACILGYASLMKTEIPEDSPFFEYR